MAHLDSPLFHEEPVRFASVYRRFADVETLLQEIEKLIERKEREGRAK